MNAQANKFQHLALLLVSVVVILSSTAGLALIMDWFPASTADSGDILALDLSVASAMPVEVTIQTSPAQAEGKARAKGRCAECGVVVYTREMDAHDEGAGLDTSGGIGTANDGELPLASARRHEITIRLADRSSRVLIHASPASWRAGERVIVIDGANPSHR